MQPRCDEGVLIADLFIYIVGVSSFDPWCVHYAIGCVLITPAANTTGADWVTRITDISPEHLSHLFDCFYRADATQARHTGGAGLGLSIAQAIAKQHGGNITMQSQPGHGISFIAWLRVQQ